MLKRKKGLEDEPLPPPTGSAPAAPAMPSATPPVEAEERTTCYPQDAQEPPPVVGQPRTTVYRQAVRWNRRTYDTIN